MKDMTFEEVEALCLAEDAGMTTGARGIEIITQEILFYKSQAGLALLEIGRRLIEAKEALPHGAWDDWLEREVEFSPRTARRFMKIAENYRETDTGVLSLGVRKALALLALSDSEREEFISEKHDISGVEKSADEMTAAELERAIRERDESEKARKEAELRAESLGDDLKVTEAKLASAEIQASQTAARLKDAEQKEAKARDRAAQLEKELKEWKSRPVEVAVEKVVDEEAVENARKAAAEAAEQTHREAVALMERELELAKAQAASATAAADKLRAAEQAALDKAEEARKQLLAADPAMAEFKLLFEQWQKGYQELDKRVTQISREDAEKGARLRAAIRAAAEPMRM